MEGSDRPLYLVWWVEVMVRGRLGVGDGVRIRVSRA